MIVEGYGIRLVRLKEEHLEQVRVWRNSEHVRSRMQYQQIIKPKDQIRWFRSIDNLQHNYFLIEVEEKGIGVINGSGIDWNKRVTNSGGIFIADSSFWGTRYPLAASLLLTDLGLMCGLHVTYAEVLSDNIKAIKYNEALGYRSIGSDPERGVIKYALDSEMYRKKRKELRDRYFSDIIAWKPKVIFTDLALSKEKFYYDVLQGAQNMGLIELQEHERQ